MNETPTSGPISESMHPPGARRDQLAPFLAQQPAEGAAYVSARNDLLEIPALGRAARAGQRGELVERALAADAPAAEQHEAIADAGGVGDLMDREEQRPAARGVRAEPAPTSRVWRRSRPSNGSSTRRAAAA